MSYGADFSNADPANAPLDPTIFIGADSFFWGAILLLLAAAVLLGWYLGSQARDRRGDAAQAIWEGIRDAVRSAMAADDNALKGRAEHLLKTIENRLGKTLGLAKGLSGRIGKLKDAIDGKGPADGHGHAGGHGAAHDAHAAHDVHAAPAVTIVNVNANANAGATSHAAGDHHPAAHAGKPEKRDLSAREQTDALRLAVAAFNQHWRDESARVRELREARAELSNPGPPRPPRPPRPTPRPASPPAGRISGTRARF